MEERASYAAGRKKPTTFRDLRDWLDRLRPDQMDAPALIASPVGELVMVAALIDFDEGADGPVVLAGDSWRKEDLHGEEH